jgi:hypothetical protein
MKFSLKYLFALITICAITIGLATQLKFRTKPPSGFNFGPDFFIAILLIGGAAITAAILPTTAIPLAILHGSPTPRLLKWAACIWAAFTGAIFVALFDIDDASSTLTVVLLAQLGAALAGALTAWPLRIAGLRLVRPISPAPSPSEPATPVSA